MNIWGIYTDWAQREGHPGGCGYYRIVQPCLYLARTKKVKVDITGEVVRKRYRWFGRNETAHETWTRVFTKADILFLQHLDNPIGIAQVFAARDHFHKRVVIDLDDDYFNVDPSSEEVRKYYHPGSDRERFTTETLRWANALTVTTLALKQLYGKYNPNIYVIPNYMDIELWDREILPRDDKWVTIGWAGSYTHRGDFKTMSQVLLEILNEYPNVRFTCCGDFPAFLDYDLLKVKDRVTMVNGAKWFTKWPEALYNMRIDIGIAPLKVNMFNRAKSPIKFFEYSMSGAASVLAGDERLPYAGVGRNGYDCFLARGELEWRKALKALIEDKELRINIANNARKKVIKEYNIKDHISEYREAFEEIKWSLQ